MVGRGDGGRPGFVSGRWVRLVRDSITENNNNSGRRKVLVCHVMVHQKIPIGLPPLHHSSTYEGKDRKHT